MSTIMISETWVLCGNHWRLPIQVSWKDSPDVARVDLHPDIPWLECWKELARSTLTSISFSQADAWFIIREELSKVAVLVEGKTAEEVVRWNPPLLSVLLPEEELNINNEKEMEEAAELRLFLKSFIDATGITIFQTIEQVEAFYFMLTQYMQIWMLERTLPVPLVFCKLMAVPMRSCWQRIVRRRSREVPYDSSSKLLGGIFNPNLRTCEKKLVFLRLEVLWCENWFRTVQRNEAETLENLGPRRYLILQNDRIRLALPYLVLSYQQHLREMLFNTLQNSWPKLLINDKLSRTPKAEEHRRLRAKRRERKRLDAEAKKQGNGTTENSEAAGVREVPDLQSQAPDVRNEGGNLPDTGGQMGEPGLPLQHDIQGDL